VAIDQNEDILHHGFIQLRLGSLIGTTRPTGGVQILQEPPIDVNRLFVRASRVIASGQLVDSLGLSVDLMCESVPLRTKLQAIGLLLRDLSHGRVGISFLE